MSVSGSRWSRWTDCDLARRIRRIASFWCRKPKKKLNPADGWESARDIVARFAEDPRVLASFARFVSSAILLLRNLIVIQVFSGFVTRMGTNYPRRGGIANSDVSKELLRLLFYLSLFISWSCDPYFHSSTKQEFVQLLLGALSSIELMLPFILR